MGFRGVEEKKSLDILLAERPVDLARSVIITSEQAWVWNKEWKIWESKKYVLSRSEIVRNCAHCFQ